MYSIQGGDVDMSVTYLKHPSRRTAQYRVWSEEAPPSRKLRAIFDKTSGVVSFRAGQSGRFTSSLLSDEVCETKLLPKTLQRRGRKS